mgnify:CR=1 FL=1|jgi:TATA-binding protein-associated factor Taf7
MESKSSKKNCICCKTEIINKRADAKYCKNCKTHKKEIYAKWRADEKREIKKHEKVLEDLIKESKRFLSIYKEAFQIAIENLLKNRSDKELKEMLKEKDSLKK